MDLRYLVLEHLIVMSFNPLLLQTFIHLVYIFSQTILPSAGAGKKNEGSANL